MTTSVRRPDNGHDDALAAALRTAIRARPADALLLSGGLDSSLLAALACETANHRPLAITVGLDPSINCEQHHDAVIACNGDLAAAQDVAEQLGLSWHPVVLDVDAALDVLDRLLRLHRSFDLGHLNNIAILAGIEEARRLGTRSFSTGDDADTLFGGYRFLRDGPDWQAFLVERIPTIAPPACRIGELMGIAPVFPYLHEDVLHVARQLSRPDIETAVPAGDLNTPPSFVDQFDTELMGRPRRPWGKAILRRIAQTMLPMETAWRPKTDLEFGSGMCAMETPLAASVSNADRRRLDATGIRWFNDAHRGLYLRFERAGLAVRPPASNEYACMSCGGGVRLGARHCPTCGAWPAHAAE